MLLCIGVPFFRTYSTSRFNRRARDLRGVLAVLGPAIAAHMSHQLQMRVPYEVLDGIPVPVTAGCRGNRHRCFADEVGIGCGAVIATGITVSTSSC